MATNPRPKIGAPVFDQLTPESRLHIDFDWWEKSDLDLKTYLYTRLDLGDSLPAEVEDQVDLVDPETAEVQRVDGFQYIVQTYFNQLPADFALRSSLVDAVFCVLLANANRPMSVAESAGRVQRAPDVLIRTFSSPVVYQGIRRVTD